MIKRLREEAAGYFSFGEYSCQPRCTAPADAEDQA
jgi:hypothetical protein